MLILAIDSSTVAASAAVLDENKLHGEIFTDLKLKHSEKLMFLVDGLLKNLRLEISDIDVFAVGEGPGSFTGLRIGAAAVKGFAQPGNKPLIGVSSLAACAYAQPASSDIFILPIFDAQQNSFYSGSYVWEDNELKNVAPDRVVEIDDFISYVKTLEKKAMLCGDGVYKYKGMLAEKLGERAVFAPAVTLMPKASSVAALALIKASRGEFSDYNSFMPKYIRASQAEVNYKVKL